MVMVVILAKAGIQILERQCGENMSRRKRAPKREILPDPLFRSELIAKFINVVMLCGKKALAERIVYNALQHVVDRLAKENKGKKAEEGESEAGSESSAGSKIVAGNIRESDAARKFALKAFEEALENVKPSVEVKSRRVGGSNYQVPVEVRASRRVALGMRWLVEFANKRNEKTMVLRLAGEILDALQHRGGTVKQRENVHAMAKANQAFAHYRW